MTDDEKEQKEKQNSWNDGEKTSRPRSTTRMEPSCIRLRDAQSKNRMNDLTSGYNAPGGPGKRHI